MFKRTIGDWIFDIFLYGFMLIIVIVFLFPFWTVLAMSFNNANDTSLGGIILWPRQFSLESFKIVLENKLLLNAYFITISRTIVGTFTATLCTGLFAYGLSKKHLIFRNFYFMVCIITMFFSGGIIATTITIRSLGLANNFLVYIIPGLYSVWNMIIMKSFFASLPASLEEAARIDGAGDFSVFFRIVIPNSMPVISVIGLMTAVGQWNAWFDAYLFITDKNLKPVQLLLQQIILGTNAASELSQFVPSESILARSITPYSVQLATLVIAIGPIIFLYPFFQRYFIKGMLIGAVKE